MMRACLAATLWILVLLAPLSAADASCTGTGCYCTVTSTAVNFGSYNALTQQAVYSTGNLEVSCGSDTIGDTVGYALILSMGDNGKKTQRKLASGRLTLNYNLYTDASHTAIWADGGGGTSTVTDSLTMTVLCCEIQNYTVYGRIDSGQNAAPGSYTDAIVVTVSY
ncbi:MAG: spore coat protein U domain-containing protein [Alphaproteobacteria bacterium]|nr:spore coat protein U domain-containing protein [Alphaproteobacteria bacterium]